MIVLQILPYPFESGMSVLLYFLLLSVCAYGAWQFISIRYQKAKGRVRSLIPLGAAGAVFGIIGLLIQYSNVMTAIEEAGDISPAIVAAGMRSAIAYPILGLFILALSFVFRFVNRVP